MKTFHYFLIGVVVLATLNGCTANRKVALVRNSVEAEKFFFNDTASVNFNYFYYGPERKPIALLALDKRYTIESEFWTKADFNGPALQNMPGKPGHTFLLGTEYRGQEIVSPNSETIGMVYSRYYWVTAWFDKENDTKITIPPPELSRSQPDYSRRNRDKP